jgi:hypothetical protein
MGKGRSGAVPVVGKGSFRAKEIRLFRRPGRGRKGGNSRERVRPEGKGRVPGKVPADPVRGRIAPEDPLQKGKKPLQAAVVGKFHLYLRIYKPFHGR